MSKSKKEVATVYPSQLRKLSDQLIEGLAQGFQKNEEYLAYVSGWIYGASKKEYEALIKRDGIPNDPIVIKLLCELAVVRGLVRWHEIRDRPPPMPSLNNL